MTIKQKTLRAPHFNHHTHEYSKLSQHVIIRYIDLFMPCEICGSLTTPRKRCSHGTLICQDHHHTSFEYLKQSEIRNRYGAFNPNNVKQNKIHVKKAKKCDICHSHRKETKDSCCYLTSVAPIYTQHRHPYRTEDNSFRVLTYRKNLIQHCCRHNGEVIINHFTHKVGENDYHKILFLKDDGKFYYKDQLSICDICDSHYNNKGCAKNITLQLTTSVSLKICHLCSDTATLESDFYKIATHTNTHTIKPFDKDKLFETMRFLIHITQLKQKPSSHLRSKKLIEFINLIIGAHRKGYQIESQPWHFYDRVGYITCTYSTLHHLFLSDHNHKSNEDNEN